MVIADVTAHAMDPRLLLSLSVPHQQVEELVAILVEIQAGLADLAVQEKVHEVVQKVFEASDQEEHQDHQRR